MVRCWLARRRGLEVLDGILLGNEMPLLRVVASSVVDFDDLSIELSQHRVLDAKLSASS